MGSGGCRRETHPEPAAQIPGCGTHSRCAGNVSGCGRQKWSVEVVMGGFSVRLCQVCFMPGGNDGNGNNKQNKQRLLFGRAVSWNNALSSWRPVEIKSSHP